MKNEHDGKGQQDVSALEARVARNINGGDPDPNQPIHLENGSKGPGATIYEPGAEGARWIVAAEDSCVNRRDAR